MPLGDSITDGYNVLGGYRINLWQRLAAGGYTVDLVGSGFNGPDSLGDHDHEGHPGWRIDQLDANIVGWLQASNPYIILLHIGTNDVNQNHDLANAPARLSALIDKIRANAPTVELFVAQITPESDPTLESRVQTFNAAIPGIVAQKGPRTHLVDMHSAITTADLADGVHPNAGGYDKMGARWFSALQSLPLWKLPTPVKGVGSDKCVDVPVFNTQDGTDLVLYSCNNGSNQQWTYNPANSEVRALGKCMEVDPADGTTVQLNTCNGGNGQKWVFYPNTRQLRTLGKCLDAKYAGTDDITPLIIWPCHSGTNQQWQLS
jgi:lysophospholipase L1-like esterase